MKGDCYASNSYFPKLYKVYKNAVSLWLKDLFREKFGEKSKKEIEENETIGRKKVWYTYQ